MVLIKDATLNDIPTIRQIAVSTWWPAYSEILSKEQITYMLNTLYSEETLQKIMKNGSQAFIFVENGQGAQGFAAYGKKDDNPAIVKLHKLYVLPESHGKGYGKLLIQEVARRAVLENITILELNVNRFNSAKFFYEKLGFKVIREEDIPIGPYWMNDYVMQLFL